MMLGFFVGGVIFLLNLIHLGLNHVK